MEKQKNASSSSGGGLTDSIWGTGTSFSTLIWGAATPAPGKENTKESKLPFTKQLELLKKNIHLRYNNTILIFYV
eukprot:UN02407